jgi:hypothetical protein
MKMENQIDLLKNYYGNHSAVARVLGLTPRHYRRIRSGKTKIKKPLKKLIAHETYKIQNP